MGGRVPDFRGLFLRGIGGNSAGLGLQQGDAIRNITGQIQTLAWRGSQTGAFYTSRASDASINGSLNNYTVHVWAEFDASRQVPTAEENRPVNKTVRYFIRAAM